MPASAVVQIVSIGNTNRPLITCKRARFTFSVEKLKMSTLVAVEGEAIDIRINLLAQDVL